MQGPACIFWANLAPFSLQPEDAYATALAAFASCVSSRQPRASSLSARFEFSGNLDDLTGVHHGVLYSATFVSTKAVAAAGEDVMR